jgi:DNA-binding MarR family transcriptional regulator
MSSTPIDPVPYVGAMLRVVSNWVRDQVYAAIVEAGYEDLNPAHLAMFRYPGPDGMRPSQLAAQLQMTKQAVNQLAGHLEERGYMVREADPVDGRGRVIRLTAKGRSVEAAVIDEARAVELRIAEILGPDGFALLQGELKHLFRNVTRSDE